MKPSVLICFTLILYGCVTDDKKGNNLLTGTWILDSTIVDNVTVSHGGYLEYTFYANGNYHYSLWSIDTNVTRDGRYVVIDSSIVKSKTLLLLVPPVRITGRCDTMTIYTVYGVSREGNKLTLFHQSTPKKVNNEIEIVGIHNKREIFSLVEE